MSVLEGERNRKGNIVLYLDKELVEKSKELGFNLSKTFENHLKHLITQFSNCNSVNTFESTGNKMLMAGGEGFEPGPKWRHHPHIPSF
jgi:hypothetical protein